VDCVVVFAPAPPPGEVPPVDGDKPLEVVVVAVEDVDVPDVEPFVVLVVLTVGGVAVPTVGTDSAGAPLVSLEAPPPPPQAQRTSATTIAARKAIGRERWRIGQFRAGPKTGSAGDRIHPLATPGAVFEIPLCELVTVCAEA